MDSTMVYQLVLEQLHTSKELVNLLPSLGTLLNPHSNMTTNQMNHQQVFSQVYKAVSSALQASQAEKELLLANFQELDGAEPISE